jgi:Flp pilus assembly protein TadG
VTKGTKLENRRGVTLVLMAFMLTAMIGMSAFAIDFGRLYLFRAQIHSAADAAALAGTFRVSQPHLDKTDARDTAISYGTRASVANTTVGLVAADVIPGSWTPGGGFVADPGLDWNSATVDAVQATTRYTGSFIFGRFFGMTTHPLSATAVAVRGSATGATCARPWAVPYQLLLNALATYYGGGPYDATTYNLTATDITHLSQMTIANNVELKIGDNTSGVVSGNFYGVELPPIVYANGTVGNPWSGGNDYRDGVGGTCDSVNAAMAAQGESDVVSDGDWLAPENGDKKGPTKQGLQTLCGLTGNNYTCGTPVRVTVAMWDTFGNAPGQSSSCGGKCFHVKYMGVFYVTGYDTGTDAVTGYFSTMAASGGFTVNPGPITTIALVR